MNTMLLTKWGGQDMSPHDNPTILMLRDNDNKGLNWENRAAQSKEHSLSGKD